MRFHFADIYLEELHSATEGEISTEVFIKLMCPFTNALIRVGEDQVYLERIHKSVFGNYLESAKNETEPSFPSVDVKVLQKTIFDMASEPETPEFCRKRLYQLHKEISAVSCVAFVPEVDDEKEEKVKEKKKSKKTKKSKGDDSDATSKESTKKVRSEEAAETIPGKKSKKTSVDETEPTKLKKKNKDSSQDVSTTGTTEKAQKVAKVAKSSSDKSSETAQAQSSDKEDAPEFIASKKFAGAKAGYAFKTVRNLFFFFVACMYVCIYLY